MTLRDAARLAAIHAASFTNPRPWSGDEIASLLSGAGCFLLAEAEGFLIGRVVADEAELLTLAVSPIARRKGIGTTLLASFLARVRAEGAAAAFLEVAADNDAAIALYRKHGFSDAGRRRGYYCDSGAAPVDAIVMRRALAPETDEI